jgi:hypothetical protein
MGNEWLKGWTVCPVCLGLCCSDGANSTGLKQTELKRQFTELWPDDFRVGDDLRGLGGGLAVASSPQSSARKSNTGLAFPLHNSLTI